ncbi:hypothetical protein WJX84_006996 [Apatococcus fuscideae]|uniref:Uncharacterized protein n=1 Tax=Apatococcus fuscideae TaxID=2026836 RepID=A0AAW1TBI3_9CHLO
MRSPSGSMWRSASIQHYGSCCPTVITKLPRPLLLVTVGTDWTQWCGILMMKWAAYMPPGGQHCSRRLAPLETMANLTMLIRPTRQASSSYPQELSRLLRKSSHLYTITSFGRLHISSMTSGHRQDAREANVVVGDTNQFVLFDELDKLSIGAEWLRDLQKGSTGEILRILKAPLAPMPDWIFGRLSKWGLGLLESVSEMPRVFRV